LEDLAVKKLVENMRPRKKEIPQISLLNPDKSEKTMKYNKKHRIPDKEKKKRMRA
jgi:hypothetical protein